MYELYGARRWAAEHRDAWSAADVPPRSDAHRSAGRCRYAGYEPAGREWRRQGGVPCSWVDGGPVAPRWCAVRPIDQGAKPDAWAAPDAARWSAGPGHGEHQDAKSAELRDAEHSNAPPGELPGEPKDAEQSCDRGPWTRVGEHRGPPDGQPDDARSNRGGPSAEHGPDAEPPSAGERWDDERQPGAGHPDVALQQDAEHQDAEHQAAGQPDAEHQHDGSDEPQRVQRAESGDEPVPCARPGGSRPDEAGSRDEGSDARRRDEPSGAQLPERGDEQPGEAVPCAQWSAETHAAASDASAASAESAVRHGGRAGSADEQRCAGSG